MKVKKKVAVIGAGLSGLTTIKELVEEGHEVTCFEKNDDIGGVFSKTGCYDSVKLTASNYFMSFSDFIPEEETVRFWTRKEYKDYLDGYASHFDLYKHIQFKCVVSEVKKTREGFTVSVEQDDRSIHTESFDNLSICSGQFQKAHIPNIKGLDTFPGKILHSSEYKNPQQSEKLFRDKKVLCLGMGESAGDVVTEVSEVAQRSVLSLRRFHVFAKKHIGNGDRYALDVYQTRWWHSLPAGIKASLVRKGWSKVLADSNIPHDAPIKHFSKHILDAPDEPGAVVTKTERIFEAVAKGMEIDIGGIEEISGSTVVFRSGRQENFDSILFCTGFEFDLPFLDSTQVNRNIRDCYLQMFHPDLRDELALIGFIRPHQGGIPLIAELQARYYALILSGKRVLPENLDKLAQKDKHKWEKEFYETPHVFGLVNGARYNETIADLIGCRPPMPSPLLSPNKFYIYWLHQIWPCQFRLVGPGARQSARDKWILAPSVDGGKKPWEKISYVFSKLFSIWMKSQLRTGEKRKWRPIFSK